MVDMPEQKRNASVVVVESTCPAAESLDEVRVGAVVLPDKFLVGKSAVVFFELNTGSMRGKRVVATCGEESLVVHGTDPGKFRSSFTPQRVGAQLLRITVSHKRADGTQESESFEQQVHVCHGPVARCVIHGLPAQIRACSAAYFQLTAQDRYGYPCAAASIAARVWYGLSRELAREGESRPGIAGSGCECELLECHLMDSPPEDPEPKITAWFDASRPGPVSYTHLTLPTKRIV
eukprot:TRINITY_DN22722_c0_g1_i1.p1 TRINITY_DN22722_c0_g1~~TRINITY_DN22722_c0_g1_i1.p1  ORF type:complete len:235 (-),score=42.91 TRINITY_DN22722_c0_g1_i1:133-837(-)